MATSVTCSRFTKNLYSNIVAYYLLSYYLLLFPRAVNTRNSKRFTLKYYRAKLIIDVRVGMCVL